MNQTLTISSREIRQIDGYFSLNDLHRASGGEERHKPKRFVRLEQTQELISEIEQAPDLALGVMNQKQDSLLENSQRPDMVFGNDDQDFQGSSAVHAYHGGANRGTYSCKEIVYAYAMWISPKFHLHVIRAFDAMYQAVQQEPSALQPQIRAMVTIEGGQITSLKDLTGCSVVKTDGLKIIQENIRILTEQLRYLEGDASGEVLERKLKQIQ